MALNPKQNRFIAEYLVDLNAAQAAIRAGYSAKTAETCGPRLLRNAQVKAAVADAMKRRSERIELKQDDVLRQLIACLNVDWLDLFDEQGRVKPLRDMKPETRSAIASMEVEEIWERNSDEDRREQVGTLTKMRVLDRLRAIELAGKHLGMFTEKVDHNHLVSIEVVDPYAEAKS